MSDFAGAVPEGGRKAGLRGWRQNDLAVDATKNDLHERRLPMARKGPRPAGDELMARDVGLQGPAERCVR